MSKMKKMIQHMAVTALEKIVDYHLDQMKTTLGKKLQHAEEVLKKGDGQNG